jgi:hypothetical protein
MVQPMQRMERVCAACDIRSSLNDLLSLAHIDVRAPVKMQDRDCSFRGRVAHIAHVRMRVCMTSTDWGFRHSSIIIYVNLKRIGEIEQRGDAICCVFH